MEVPVVIVAEDGVTSLRYYFNILRDAQPGLSDNGTAWDNSTAGGLGEGFGPMGPGGPADVVQGWDTAALESPGLGSGHTFVTQRGVGQLVPPFVPPSSIPAGAFPLLYR